LLGLFTPITIFRTGPVAALAAFGGYRIARRSKTLVAKEEEQAVRSKVEDVKKPESVMSLLDVEPIEFEFGYGLIPIVDSKQGGDLLDRVVMIRRQLALELGLVIPVIRLRDNIQLRPSEYSIKVRGVEVAKGELMIGHYLAMSPGPEDPSITGVATKEPAFGLPALWISAAMRLRAETVGYTVVDPPAVVATHLTEVLRRHAHELLTRQDTKALLDHVAETSPAAVQEVTPNPLSIGEVQRVLANLLQEKVSIRDLVTILESLADGARQTKDIDALTEMVRQALARQICHQFRLPDEPLTVITFSPAVEESIQNSLVHHDGGVYVNLSPDASARVFRRLREEANKLSATGKTPVLLVHPQLRLPLRRWIVRSLPDIVLLSYNELDPAVDIESAGVVNL
jgi:flagellar biosynthesis protein FlhA